MERTHERGFPVYSQREARELIIAKLESLGPLSTSVLFNCIGVLPMQPFHEALESLREDGLIRQQVEAKHELTPPRWDFAPWYRLKRLKLVIRAAKDCIVGLYYLSFRQ